MTLIRSSFLVCVLVLLAQTQAFSSSGGITFAVTAGCTCHGNPSSATSLTIPGRSNAITVRTGETISLSLMVAHTSQRSAGMNLAVVNTSGADAGTLIAGAGSQLISGQLTHTAPQAMSGGNVEFPFQWTAPSTPGTYTLRAAGNAVNADGGTGGDAFNFLAPVTITVENAAPTTFSISGRILNASGVAVAGALVSDGTRSATTDAQGNYTITGVPNGTYTLTPSLVNWIFEPTTLSVTVNGANLSGQNIVGRRLWSITGTILSPTGVAVPNVIVTAVSGTTLSSTATTDAAGNYTLWVLNGTYTVRPSLTNWVFEPTTVPVTVNGANLAGQNIVGRRLWAVTGTIQTPAGAPVSDVIITATLASGGAIVTSATTDAQGNYTIWLVNGAYSIRASRTNWVFATPSLTTTVNGANITSQNFAGSRLWAVTGTIVNPNNEPVPNVSISASGGRLVASTATTDAQGNYTLWLVNGAYTLTPSRANWAFTPTSLAITVAGANLTADRVTGRVLMSVRNTPSVALTLAPNPASEQTTVSYTISSPKRIRYEVFNVIGERVRNFNEQHLSGTHQYVIPTEGLTSGMYIVRISSEGEGVLGSAAMLVRGK